MARRQRLLLISLVVVWVGLILACAGGSKKSGSTQPGGGGSVEVVKVRVEPYRSATGIDTVMVYVDWKNTGDRPVRVVDAKIKGFDAAGNAVEVMSVPSYTIYATFNDKPGVAPGETYTEPQGEGFVAPKLPGAVPTRATAEITKVSEKGME